MFTGPGAKFAPPKKLLDMVLGLDYSANGKLCAGTNLLTVFML